MSQLFETFRCGDGEALVTYVYGESSPAAREAIAAHLAHCAACAEEVAALGSTRVQLAAWTPPATALGFQVRRADAVATLPETPPGPAVLRPAAWWRQPLPAWAQMAAAVLIFGSGLTIGLARGASSSGLTAAPATVATNQVPAVATPATTAAAAGAVTREELAQVEQRLLGELAQTRTVARVPAVDDRAVMQRVSQMIAASEARQQNELELRTSQMVRDFSNTRRIDLANIEKRLGVTSVKVLSNQQDINSLAQRVGYSPGYSPYVP